MQGWGLSSSVTAALVLSILSPPPSLCWPNGAPSGACSSLTPGHDTNPQNSVAPYKIQVNPLDPMTYEVTIDGASSKSSPFKGFIMQVRTTKTLESVKRKDQMSNSMYTFVILGHRWRWQHHRNLSKKPWASCKRPEMFFRVRHNHPHEQRREVWRHREVERSRQIQRSRTLWSQRRPVQDQVLDWNHVRGLSGARGSHRRRWNRISRGIQTRRWGRVRRCWWSTRGRRSVSGGRRREGDPSTGWTRGIQPWRWWHHERGRKGHFEHQKTANFAGFSLLHEDSCRIKLILLA